LPAQICVNNAKRPWEPEIKGFYPFTIINPFAWPANKRKKPGPIMKTLQEEWSRPALKKPINPMAIRPAIVFIIFVHSSANEQLIEI
jgi:hypothetical protein